MLACVSIEHDRPDWLALLACISIEHGLSAFERVNQADPQRIGTEAEITRNEPKLANLVRFRLE